MREIGPGQSKKLSSIDKYIEHGHTLFIKLCPGLTSADKEKLWIEHLTSKLSLVLGNFCKMKAVPHNSIIMVICLCLSIGSLFVTFSEDLRKNNGFKI